MTYRLLNHRRYYKALALSELIRKFRFPKSWEMN